jgi:hypothetical protein
VKIGSGDEEMDLEEEDGMLSGRNLGGEGEREKVRLNCEQSSHVTVASSHGKPAMKWKPRTNQG